LLFRDIGALADRIPSDGVRAVALIEDGERGSPKYEKATMRWLERYLAEGSPRLQHFAEIAHELAQREPDTDG
jgi:hypothetical protein